jgi:hypothetical protein
MGFFSNIFGGSSDIEQQIEDTYVPMYVAGKGMSLNEARKAVRDLIQQVKEEAEKEGTADIPQDYGDTLIDSEHKTQAIKTMLEKRRKEGVRDEDIRWWWNMHDLERRFLDKDDELSRVALFIHNIQEGRSSEEAAALVKKYFPIFGDPDDTSTSSGDDRPLPYELKDRINIYIQNRSTDSGANYKKDIEKYSSFNSLVRREIKSGRL